MITYFMTSSRTFGSEKASSRAKSPKWVSGPPPIFSRCVLCDSLRRAIFASASEWIASKSADELARI